jgi:hypothetical protein
MRKQIANNKIEHLQKKAVMTQFKELRWSFPEKNVGNHEKCLTET